MKLQIDLDVPDKPVDERLLAELTAACKQELILHLYAQKRVSGAEAAQLLGLTRIEFMELTNQHGIPHLVYTSDDYNEDVQDLDKFERDGA